MSCLFSFHAFSVPSSPSCKAQECRIGGLLQTSATRQDGLLGTPEGKASKRLLPRCSPRQGLAIAKGCALH